VAGSAPHGWIRWHELVRRPVILAFALGMALVAACAPPPTVGGAPPPRGPAPPGSPHLALGEPRDADPSDDLVLDHRVLVLSFNSRRQVPNWVAWRLVAEDLGEAPRSGAFHADELLPPGIPGPRPRDYARSGFERGHMCPSGDRTATEAANEETFVMTNMQPQRHALNAGPWEGLERFERSLATAGQQLFVVAGGVFDEQPATLASGIAVPRASFKVIVALAPGEDAADVTASTTTYAVIMPNSADVAGTRWFDHLVSIDEVERQSGYDFLTRVAPDTQARLEPVPATVPPILSPGAP